ncbi:hypothetical protein [Paracraurococcus ruber]|uniref:Glycosyltransferase RgtA/B/C/D-like domain-containing protein n=1 Tax=Paracraurococcus ruber TaxID=77675 RepID=A0ABS1CRE6_9PROT|nr:hypothetical protein [Paracraurococcus ruber]MBK1656751.1 hypothetical protein [Paracraurococcus ruber]TDG30111.1 hypothetical protein E2C05_15540 [Paracraurococcus ruber]
MPRTDSPRFRLPLAALCGALCLGFFFRFQLGNGFTLLLGDRHDGVIALSILEHWWNWLRGLEAWDRTGYFHPVPATLGYNDGYLLFGLIHAGFRAAGLDPFLSGELVNVATRGIGFAATLALGRRLLGLPFGWALLGAALFTISNNLFIRGSHVQLFSVSFVPVLALLGHGALRALLDGRRAALLAWGAGFALWFAAMLLTGFYMAWYSAFLAAALLPCWLLVAGAAARGALWRALRAQWWGLALLLGLAALANLPFLLLYLPKAAETGMHPWPDVLRNAPEWPDLVNVGQENWLWGWLVRALNDAVRPGFPAWSERMTGLPPLLLAGWVAALAWLARRPALPPAQHALLRALGLATLLTWALTVQVGGATLWSLVYQYVPGAKAPRVVARYQIFLTLAVIVLAMAFLASRRWPRPVLLALAGLLLLEQGNSYAPLFLDRPLEAGRLAAVPPPPAGCRAFWVSAARTESRFGEAVADPYNHNTEAMLVAALRHIPTINGISTFNPPHWPGGIPEDPGYPAAVAAYARAWGVTGLCALDLRRFAWTGPEGR